MAHSPEDLELIRSIGMTSFVSVPLISRDRRIGALTLVQAWSGRRQDEQDAQLARVLGDRAALVLENAIFSDLESIEQRMDVVIDIIDEAVTVNDVDGDLIFANRAAVELTGCESLEELLRSARRGNSDSRSTGSRRGRFGRGQAARRHSRTACEPAGDRLVRPDGEEIWLQIRCRTVTGFDGRAVPGLGVRGRHGSEGGGVRAGGARRGQRTPARRASHAAIISGLASTVVPLLADACAVFVPGADGVYEAVSFAHDHPERAADLERLIAAHPLREEEAGLQDHLNTGEPFVFGDLTQPLDLDVIGEERRARLDDLDVRSLLVVPLAAGPKLVGIMVLANYVERLALGERIVSRRGRGGADRPFGRERPGHVRAQRDRRDAPGRAQLTSRSQDPGLVAGREIPAGGIGKSGRRRLLRLLPDRGRLDGGDRRRHRPRCAGRHGHRARPLYAAHGGVAHRGPEGGPGRAEPVAAEPPPAATYARSSC